MLRPGCLRFENVRQAVVRQVNDVQTIVASAIPRDGCRLKERRTDAVAYRDENEPLPRRHLALPPRLDLTQDWGQQSRAAPERDPA